MKKTLLIILIIFTITTTLLLSSCAQNSKGNKLLPVIEGYEIESEYNFDAVIGEAGANERGSGAVEPNKAVEQSNNKDGEDAQTEKTSDTFARIDILLQAKVSGLNVRSEPKSSAKSLGSLDKGDYISFHGENNGWYTTFYKEKRAYVSAAYCNVIEVSASSGRIERIIDEGKKLLGYPYIWGSERYHWGNGKLNSNFVSGKFDCSALMQYIFYKGDNVLLGLTTREQVIQGQKLTKSEIERGDLLFFTNSSRKNLKGIERVGHVALYLGDNLILHTASDYACIEVISKARWDYFISGSRI